MGALTSLLFATLLLVLHVQGFVGFDVARNVAVFIVAAIVVFYVIFSKGWNRYARDPSLTLPQIGMAAITVLYVMLQAEGSRGSLAIVLGMALLFAVFRYRTRELFVLAGALLFAYGSVLAVIWHLRPAARESGDVADFIAMCFALPWFAWIGGHINKLRDRLEERKRFYETIWENAADTILVVDSDGLIDYVNPAVRRLLGREPEALIGTPVSLLQDPTGAADTRRAIEGWQRDSAWGTLETEALRADGTRVAVEITVNHVILRGEPAQVAFVRDITERRHARQTLAASEERFRRLTALSSDWYWEQDAELRYSVVSSGILTEGGVAPESLIGKTSQELIADPHWPDAESHAAVLAERRPFRDVEYPVRTPAGEIRWFSSDGEPMFDARGAFRGYYGTGRDITERKANEEHIRYNATHDVLTGLANRNLLRDRLALAIAQSQRSKRSIWVVFIDLDRFKIINDSLSHKTGDELLQQVAQRLTAATRETDTVARQGGDEFVMVLPEGTDGHLSERVLERLLASLAEPFRVGGQEIFVTCSAGVAVYPGDGNHPEELIEHADIAMYRAKDGGRNTYHFYTREMNDQALARLRLENALRLALERNEFVLHYQPQYSLRDGSMVGCEALIRWQHPTEGLLRPGSFIGIAEEMGLIQDVGEWVLREDCRQARAWRETGRGLCMAVNLSARQFSHPDLVAMVAGVLGDTGLPPAELELELTESLLMDDIDHNIRTLEGLRGLGVRLAIDDFGTGYSSLAYLKRLPVDVLKIDRSFVRDSATNHADAAIVASVVGLAHNLGLVVIAEGVEDAAQLRLLEQKGCDQVQGYLLSQPVPAEELERLLREQPVIALAANRLHHAAR